MVSDESMIKYKGVHSYTGYEARDGESHRARAFEWLEKPQEEREQFFKDRGARYYELSRLPYFDPVRMCVIYPMHNILLGESASVQVLI